MRTKVNDSRRFKPPGSGRAPPRGSPAPHPPGSQGPLPQRATASLLSLAAGSAGKDEAETGAFTGFPRGAWGDLCQGRPTRGRARLTPRPKGASLQWPACLPPGWGSPHPPQQSALNNNTIFLLGFLFEKKYTERLENTDNPNENNCPLSGDFGIPLLAFWCVMS